MMQYIYPDGKIITEPDKKFSCNELKQIFNSRWFKLCFMYSNYSTDYYMCSLDIHGMKINDLPEYNKRIKELFNRDVYGVAIIAPSSMF